MKSYCWEANALCFIFCDTGVTMLKYWRSLIPCSPLYSLSWPVMSSCFVTSQGNIEVIEYFFLSHCILMWTRDEQWKRNQWLLVRSLICLNLYTCMNTDKCYVGCTLCVWCSTLNMEAMHGVLLQMCRPWRVFCYKRAHSACAPIQIVGKVYRLSPMWSNLYQNNVVCSTIN